MRVHGVSLVSLSPYATTADHDGLSFAPGPFGSVSRRTFVAPRVFLFLFFFPLIYQKVSSLILIESSSSVRGFYVFARMEEEWNSAVLKLLGNFEI